MFNLISIQLNGKDNIDENLKNIDKLVYEACQKNHSLLNGKSKLPPLVVLPECASIFGVNSTKMLDAAEVFNKGPVQQQFSAIAKKHSCYLVAGTTPIWFEQNTQKHKFNATSLVFSPQGDIISHYSKIHLFDVEVADKTKSYKESKTTIAGKNLSCFEIQGVNIAQAVCYDLRFADMFSAYANVNQAKQAPHVIVLPSAFTKVTGKAHWHALLKARSIENQCFVVASNQVGTHSDNRETFGNSCIYSPWGECLDVIEDGDGYAIAEYNSDEIHKIRTNMPISKHKKERYKFES